MLCLTDASEFRKNVIYLFWEIIYFVEITQKNVQFSQTFYMLSLLRFS